MDYHLNGNQPMKKNFQVAIVIAASLMASVANASDATTAIAAIGTEAGALASAAWPILIAVTTAVIGMKLFKKFAGKAT